MCEGGGGRGNLHQVFIYLFLFIFIYFFIFIFILIEKRAGGKNLLSREGDEGEREHDYWLQGGDVQGNVDQALSSHLACALLQLPSYNSIKHYTGY